MSRLNPNAKAFVFNPDAPGYDPQGFGAPQGNFQPVQQGPQRGQPQAAPRQPQAAPRQTESRAGAPQVQPPKQNQQPQKQVVPRQTEFRVSGGDVQPQQAPRQTEFRVSGGDAQPVSRQTEFRVSGGNQPQTVPRQTEFRVSGGNPPQTVPRQTEFRVSGGDSQPQKAPRQTEFRVSGGQEPSQPKLILKAGQPAPSGQEAPKTQQPKPAPQQPKPEGGKPQGKAPQQAKHEPKQEDKPKQQTQKAPQAKEGKKEKQEAKKPEATPAEEVEEKPKVAAKVETKAEVKPTPAKGEAQENWFDEDATKGKEPPKTGPQPVVENTKVEDEEIDGEIDQELADELREIEMEERKGLQSAPASGGGKAVHDDREHLNIVCIGHVDAGKSTISGQILLQTGQVDERTIAKYEREAKEKNRESWYLAYIMDTSEEERAKGKTVEVGRAHFTTTHKRYTLLDAPGHKNYVPNMIGGTAQADVGVLVISARKGEFETGFDRGGQTREHAMLAKTLGIQRLVVMVNKMDDPTVQWSQERYDAILAKLSPFLQQWGYNLAKEVQFIPVSGFTGANIKDRVSSELAPWYKGESFLELLDNMRAIERNPDGPVRIPVMAKYKDMGVLCILGKIESGTLRVNAKLRIAPTGKDLVCTGILIEDAEVQVAGPGENVVVKAKGAEEEDINVGFVLSDPLQFPKRARSFVGQVAVLDLLEHKPLITAGYLAVLHVHTLSVECVITKLLSETDRKTNKKLPKRPRFARSGSYVEIEIQVEETIAIETFKDFSQMGRFTLRDEGKTIAVGRVATISEETSDADK